MPIFTCVDGNQLNNIIACNVSQTKCSVSERDYSFLHTFRRHDRMLVMGLGLIWGLVPKYLEKTLDVFNAWFCRQGEPWFHMSKCKYITDS